MNPPHLNSPRFNLWLVVVLVGGVFYPLLVYVGLSVVPPLSLVCVGLGLIGMRLLAMPPHASTQSWRIAFMIAALALIILLCIDVRWAAQAYPVIISLTIAALFGWSLFFPPSLVERIARITEPYLSPQGVIYTRRVTIIWVGCLLLNAAISTATAVWGTLVQWTLWNGCLSYIMMGLLFAAEWLMRQKMKRDERAGRVV